MINNTELELKKYQPILELLLKKQDQLEIILSQQPADKNLKYLFKGKRKNCTLNYSQSLQEVFNKCCKDKKRTKADLLEIALLDFLKNNGYEEDIKTILKATYNCK